MRITTSMMAQASRKSGLPLLQGNLLEVLNKQNAGKSTNLLDAFQSKQKSEQASAVQKNYQELGKAADNLSSYASRLQETGEKSLFVTEEGEEGMKDVLTEIKDLLAAYNHTLELLKNADGSLNSFYQKELKQAASSNAELLGAVGITQGKDGLLTADEKALNGADYDTLKKAFGETSDFIKRTAYISGKIAENAEANAASVSNQYNAKGVSYSDSFGANKYNFFG